MRKLTSHRLFHNQVFITIISEKECSTEAVPTGKVGHTFAMALKLGHIVSNIVLVDKFFQLFIHIRLRLTCYVSLKNVSLDLQIRGDERWHCKLKTNSGQLEALYFCAEVGF